MMAEEPYASRYRDTGRRSDGLGFHHSSLVQVGLGPSLCRQGYLPSTPVRELGGTDVDGLMVWDQDARGWSKLGERARRLMHRAQPVRPVDVEDQTAIGYKLIHDFLRHPE